MRWLLLVGLVGCKFTPGELARDGAVDDDDAAADAQGDATGDAAETTCNSKWRNGTIRFGTPSALTAVNSAQFDRDPFLAPDELTLWVSSGRTGGASGSSAVWIAKRTIATAAFDPPQVDATFDSTQSETKLSITEDGLFAVLGSTRTGSQAVDVWEASRATTNDNWSALTRTHMGMVNSATDEHDPTISADGLRLYVALTPTGTQHISVATRLDRTSNFGVPSELTELTSGMGDADPSPTPDEQVLLFASNRPILPSGPAAPNVWYATRPGSTGAFDAPLPVPDINTDMPEGDPHLSADGCRIYFARNVGTTDYDIFVATALP
jgi:hypothetical protein